MKKLWLTLPAFSPDYSGVCSAMFELNGLCVIHDASGCTGNYTGYDEPRWYGSQAKIYCSGLREIDAVLGRDDKLIDEILAACRDVVPAFVTILGSPVPMVIGTDMEGIACEVEDRSGLPAFGFNTNGLRLYNTGISQAMCALIHRFTRQPEKKIERGVNILGMTPLDFSTNSNANDLRMFLSRQKFSVVGSLMMGVTLTQIEQLAQAQVNLVVTEAGLAPAVLLQREYGIPYVAGLPLGTGEEVYRALSATLEDGKNRVLRDTAQEGDILIVSEQVLGNSIRRELLRMCPQSRVTVGSMFGLNPELASPEDLDIPDEESLLKIINSHRFSKLVGDPLFGELVGPDDGLTFYPLPHPAVSSKIFWDKVPTFLSDNMKEFLHIIVQNVTRKEANK